MNDKTIRMPKELLAKWLAALRSGEYKQARGCLANETGFCCLGVLMSVADPSSLKKEMGVPSTEFLERHGISFTTTNPPDESVWGSPGNPYLPAFKDCAAGVNDKGTPFAEIADAIEACAEGV